MVTLVALFPPAAVLSARHADGRQDAAARPGRDRLGRRAAVGVGDRRRRSSARSRTGFVIVPLVPTDVAVFARRRRCSCSRWGRASPARAAPARRERAPRRRRSAALDARGRLAVRRRDRPTTARGVDRRTRRGRPGATLVLDDVHALLRRPRRPALPRVRLHALDRRRDRRDAPAAAPLDARVPRRRRLHAAALPAPRRGPGRARACSRSTASSWSSRASGSGCAPARGLRVRVGDARVTLRDEPAASADLVVGDAFGSARRAVAPRHRGVRRRGPARAAPGRPLRAQRDRLRRRSGSLRAEAATLLEAFDELALVTQPDPAATSSCSRPTARCRPWRGRACSTAPRSSTSPPAPIRCATTTPPADQLLTPRA